MLTFTKKRTKQRSRGKKRSQLKTCFPGCAFHCFSPSTVQNQPGRRQQCWDTPGRISRADQPCSNSCSRFVQDRCGKCTWGRRKRGWLIYLLLLIMGLGSIPPRPPRTHPGTWEHFYREQLWDTTVDVVLLTTFVNCRALYIVIHIPNEMGHVCFTYAHSETRLCMFIHPYTSKKGTEGYYCHLDSSKCHRDSKASQGTGQDKRAQNALPSYVQIVWYMPCHVNHCSTDSAWLLVWMVSLEGALLSSWDCFLHPHRKAFTFWNVCMSVPQGEEL